MYTPGRPALQKNEVHAHTFKRGHVKLKTKTQQEAACTHSLAPVTKQPEPVHAQQSVIHLESLISIFFLKKKIYLSLLMMFYREIKKMSE